MPETDSERPPAPSNGTLNSWKEIAAFFDVTTRTVQTWEKERGLPVHRLGDSPRARIFACIEELEEWRAGQELLSRTQPAQSLTRSGLFLGGAILGLVLLGIAIVVYGIHIFSSSANGNPDHLAIKDSEVTALSSDNRVCWQRSFEGLLASSYRRDPSGRMYLLEDIDENGEVETLLFHHQYLDRKTVSDALYCISARGEDLWSITPGTRLGASTQHRSFGNVYKGRMLRVVEADGRKYLLVVSVHTTYYPTQVLLLDPRTGTILHEYWHPGLLERVLLLDVDGDGDRELIACGVNNPEDGLGYPALLVLDIPFRSRPAGTPGFFEMPTAIEEKYLLLPRPDVFTEELRLPLLRPVKRSGEDRISAYLRDHHIEYVFDYDLNLIEHYVNEDLKERHVLLEREGKLDHPLTEAEIESWGRPVYFPTAPDGNGEETVRLMEGSDK